MQRYLLLITCFLVSIISKVYGQGTDLLLSADSESAMPGAEVLVPVRVNGFTNIIAAQGTIVFDPKVVSLLGVEKFGLPSMGTSNIGTTRKDQGEIVFAWDDATLAGESLNKDAILFLIRFKVTGGAGASTPISFANTPAVIEVLNKDFVTIKVITESGKLQVLSEAPKVPSAPVVSSVSYCLGSAATALTATGTNLLWYTAATGGTGS
ncbi:cohesin domain-containing protein, partial [Adhaeribacter aquaticus]|uniref:cohesin domain-containing protein n=1 Tax=Adhaeribacter aquaticus TaxID=299567 RepID=UPI00054E8073